MLAKASNSNVIDLNIVGNLTKQYLAAYSNSSLITG
jgi:hypothetical protein